MNQPPLTDQQRSFALLLQENIDLKKVALELAKACLFMTEFYDVGGNGEGWTLAEVAEFARGALKAAEAQGIVL